MYYWNNSTSALFPFVTFRSMYATCGMCGTTLQYSSSTISLWADCGNFLSVCFHYKNCEQDIEALYDTGKGRVKKKNYESSDICPNWVYPTYLVAQYGQKKVWTSTPIVYPTYLSKKFGHF